MGVRSKPIQPAELQRFLRSAGLQQHVVQTDAGPAVDRVDGTRVLLEELETHGQVADAFTGVKREQPRPLLGADTLANYQALARRWNNHFNSDHVTTKGRLKDYTSKVSVEDRKRYWLSEKSFSIPLISVASKDTIFRTAKRVPAALARQLEAFEASLKHGDQVSIPVHPLVQRGLHAPAEQSISNAHNDSSIRTLQLPREHGAAPLDLKMDFPIAHFSAVRNQTPSDALACVEVTDQLFAVFAKDRRLAERLAFLPEPMMIAARHPKLGAFAHVVRVMAPHPPHAEGGPTYAMPVFALTQTDTEDPAPDKVSPLEWMIDSRPDKSQSPLDYYLETFERAAFEGLHRLEQKHGLWHTSSHGQNIAFEIDASGAPTGRLVLQDLEEISPYRARKLKELGHSGYARAEFAGLRAVVARKLGITTEAIADASFEMQKKVAAELTGQRPSSFTKSTF